MKIRSFQRSLHVLLQSVPLTCQQAATDPCFHRRLLDTPRQVWVSLWWRHCSFLLCLGWCEQDFVCTSESLSPQSCVSSGCSMVGLMETSSKKAYAVPRSAAPRALPCGSPLLTHTSTGDAQTQFWLSLCVLVCTRFA